LQKEERWILREIADDLVRQSTVSAIGCLFSWAIGAIRRGCSDRLGSITLDSTNALRSEYLEAAMGNETGQGQSGGVNISGSVGSVGGDIVGRDKITGAPSAAALNEAFRPLIETIKAAPAEVQPEAEAKLAALKQEAAKGKAANDSTVAKLVDGLVGLVPGAVSAVVSAFATPLLGGIAGPTTRFVLDKLQGK
jgi:hypothetical protein